MSLRNKLMHDIQKKTEAVLQLLPEDCFDDAETDTNTIKLEGVADEDRRIDTVVKHCRTLLMPHIRASVEHDEDTATIKLEVR